MVAIRSSSSLSNSYYKSRSNRSRFLLPSSISKYVFVLIGLSFVFLFFSQSQISDVVDKPLISEEEPQSQELQEQLWDTSFSYVFRPCVQPTHKYEAPDIWDRYITVRSNGGLNQMRAGICDMVAVTHIMNATLVIPQLDKRSFWHDSSTFSDIFDEAHFNNSLRGDVRIVQELPKEWESAPRVRKHFTSWSSVNYYEEMTRLWKEYKVIHVPKSDSRLANSNLPIDIQRLRCRALYQALRFSAPIETLGKNLVERLSSNGRYITLHLRYEKDMLSFTGCTYGLNDTEAEELRIMRENTNHWKTKNINSTEQRTGGFCPSTPKEVGMFLRALGYPRSMWIYVAAGEIYGGEKYLSDLRSHFPNLVFKDTLATKEELKQFARHATQNAALDYMISVESDVFVPSYMGNMARAVEGHHRFLGHRKTINPDRKGLVELFDKIEKGELNEGPTLSSLVTQLHKFRQGAPRKRYGSLLEQKGRNGLEPKNPSTKTRILNASVDLKAINEKVPCQKILHSVNMLA